MLILPPTKPRTAWLICIMLMHTLPLHSVCLVFSSDIPTTVSTVLFSRLRAAIAGRDYYTVAELIELPGFHLRHSHLHTVCAWKEMEADLNLPILKCLRRVHVVDFFTYQGAVLVKWKHDMSSDKWSNQFVWCG